MAYHTLLTKLLTLYQEVGVTIVEYTTPRSGQEISQYTIIHL